MTTLNRFRPFLVICFTGLFAACSSGEAAQQTAQPSENTNTAAGTATQSNENKAQEKPQSVDFNKLRLPGDMQLRDASTIKKNPTRTTTTPSKREE